MQFLHHSAATKRLTLYCTKLLISFLVLYLIARQIDLRATAQAFSVIPAGALAAALVAQLASNSVAAFRWHLIMHTIGIQAPLTFFLKSYFKGAFFNQGLPASIGGDGLRILDATRITPAKEDAFFGVFIDRIIGLAGLLLLNIAALAVNHSLLPQPVYLPLLGVMLLLFLGLVALFFLHRMPLFQGENRLAALGRLSARYRQVYASPRAIALQTGLSVLTHLLGMTTFACLGYGVGLRYPLEIYLALVPPVVLLTILPISLAGWGVREGAMIGFFLLIGAAKAPVLSLSLSYGLLNLVAALPGLLVYLGQKNRL